MNREKSLETIIIFALVSQVIYLWRDITWLLYVSIGFLILSLVSKKATSIVGNVWLAFSIFFGKIMNHIILSIIFFLLLFPLAVFQKLAGKNQILKKGDSNTYFHKRNHIFTKKDIERPW